MPTPPPPTVTIAPGDTLHAYDRWAQQYDLDDNPMVAITDWRLANWPLQVAGARVVELGCGTGRNAPRLLAAGAAGYCGVDGSAGMLAEARRRTEEAAATRCTWLEAELDHLPELAAHEPRYDAALIVLVLEHLTDLSGPFAGLASWLRPGAPLRVLELHPERVTAGTVAHFHQGGVEQRFSSVGHPVPTIIDALTRGGFVVDDVAELLADDELIAIAPRLAKHRGKPVVLDLTAHRR